MHSFDLHQGCWVHTCIAWLQSASNLMVLSNSLWHFASHSLNRFSSCLSAGEPDSSSSDRLSLNVSLLRVTRKPGPRNSAPLRSKQQQSCHAVCKQTC